MIASFFQHLEAEGVDWLLISGQATILYGAATFSEDVDLWVKPDEGNFDRLVRALRACHARYYKLTPPLSVQAAERHHGFHFVLPGMDAGADLYLDVMGCPPRVGSFTSAQNNARAFSTQWGDLPTVGIRELVEIKKTQRPRDYPIISRLALALLQEGSPHLTDEDLEWARDHVFDLTEFTRLFTEYPGVRVVLEPGSTAERAAIQLELQGHLDADLEDELDVWFEQRMAPLRKADRRFWRPVIDELRLLRAQSRLMPEGAVV